MELIHTHIYEVEEMFLGNMSNTARNKRGRVSALILHPKLSHKCAHTGMSEWESVCNQSEPAAKSESEWSEVTQMCDSVCVRLC